jgi:hypothetical protein
MQELKLCKDCKYSFVASTSGMSQEDLFDRYGEGAMCGWKPMESLVTGQYLPTPFCMSERSERGRCGISAKNFEARNPKNVTTPEEEKYARN